MFNPVEDTLSPAPPATAASTAGQETVVQTPDFGWQLPAETITVRIHWFGLCVGYLLVNVLGTPHYRVELNWILTLGAVYALIDTWWSAKGQVFLERWPLFISGMEAIFIGLLCHFDQGLNSLFRFYYFLSLIVCAFRNSPMVTICTLGFHFISYIVLALVQTDREPEQMQAFALQLVFMAWVTWASTALATLVKGASRQLLDMNTQLTQNQALLEQRIAERTQELQQSQALLVQHEKQAAFGLLAAGIAHEVGNPLTAISNLVQLLNRRPLDADMHERLNLIDEQLRRIQRTLRELVDFSRPASNTRTTCDVHGVLDSALNIAKYYKRMKGKKIVTSYEPNLPAVSMVRDRVLQVFLNLILNALDSTQEGAVIELATESCSDGIRILIRDEGTGIPAMKQDLLFKPYFTTKETGTGLGLFVCRNILQEAGGRIELVCSTTAGTTFAVTLPAASPATTSHT
ncbi:MAG: ATP-binding protein [Planctomycetaceae bacterium]